MSHRARTRRACAESRRVWQRRGREEARERERVCVCPWQAPQVLDEGVGNVTAALKRRGQWSSSLVVFVSDNGGPTHGNEGTASNNFPMRGGKNTLWEGGTRVVAAVRGPIVGAAMVGRRDHLPSYELRGRSTSYEVGVRVTR